VTIGAHCCLSQRAFLCAGNHDYRRPDMAYRNALITLGDGVSIGARASWRPA
jgi:putative colanic acid biosynthesis acetyltransferase WcaF